MNVNASFTGYRCSLCGQEYAPGEAEYVCPRHGDSGNLDVVLDYERLRRALTPAAPAASGEGSLWRYLPLLPVTDPGFLGTPLRAAGWTPLYHAQRLGAALGLSRLFIKDDGRIPTASFKDRASAVVVARARKGRPEIVDDHLGTGVRERERVCTADPASCTRDDGHLALEVRHAGRIRSRWTSR
jgi:threonine synthase